MKILFFTNDKFEYMAKYLIQSLDIQQVDAKYLYYTIGFQSNISHPNLIKRSWPLDNKKPRFEFYKPDIFIDALTNYDSEIVFLDSDVIVGKRFNIDYFKHNLDYPLASVGNWDCPFAYITKSDGSEEIINEERLMKRLGVKDRSANYVYTCFMSLNRNCIDFLKEWKNLCEDPYLLERREIYYPLHDETSFNVLLWKRGATENYGRIYLNTLSFEPLKFIEETENYQGHVFDVKEQRCDNSDRVMFYHGIKDVNELNKSIRYLSRSGGSSVSKILFITPHLSTGGLPQYLYKKIDRIVKDTRHDIHLIEWEDLAPIYKVQRDAIKRILPKDNFIYWPQNTKNNIKIDYIKNYINKSNFDIIHIEEFPEYFLPNNLIDFIYNKAARSYKIIETSHNSGFNPVDKKVLPDAFVFVSQYQLEKFKRFKIPTYLAKYPIEKHERPNREDVLKKLNLDPDYKHVLNVGLFTPGKNQGYAFQIAKLLEIEKIKFHFIGNQAGNFQHYWEPLMQNKPDNCIIHGERDDVDDWYAACDLLLFTSTSELNPLVPREALSWSLPLLMNNLPIYLNEYSKYNLVHYLTNDLLEDSNRVKKLLNLPYENIVFGKSKNKYKIRLIHLLTRPDEEREQASINSLQGLQKYGIQYIQHVNEPCTVYPDTPPAVLHDEKKPGYYGAYLAFRRAIEEEFTNDLDFFMICECDCVLSVDTETFYNRLIKICEKVNEHEIDYFSFGPHIDNQTGEVWTKSHRNIDDEIFIGDRVILAHCIMFRKGINKYLCDQYQKLPWDSPDIWLNDALRYEKKIGLLFHPLAEQHEGQSFIDTERKGTVSKVIDKDLLSVLNEVYQETDINVKKIKRSLEINVNFMNGAFAEVIDHNITPDRSDNTKYDYTFYDNNIPIYETSIPANHYAKTIRQWFTNWRVEIKRSGESIFRHVMNLNNKKVIISFGSSSLGDTIAWIPYVEEFRKKHNSKVYCSTFWNHLFRKSYPEIDFIPPGTSIQDIYASYSIGCYVPQNDVNRHPVDWRTVPLQKVASDILGLQYKEIKAKIDLPKNNVRPINEKYVCIAIHSTCQAKYWNHPEGWSSLVDYFNSIGYKVMHISKESGTYMGNSSPPGVLDMTGNKSIEERINQINHSEMFISISSGLSWISWVLNKPTVIISGVTKPFNEPSENIIRIHNNNVCNGCFNSIHYNFDKGNWNWCPNNQNFICSRSITPDKVISIIKGERQDLDEEPISDPIISNSVPEFVSVKKPRIIVSTGVYNAQDYIARCIHTIKSQDYVDFRCFIFDDASTDDTLRRAIQAIDCDPRFSVISNSRNLYALQNIYNLYHRKEIFNDDIIVNVDGDDFLPDNQVFDRIVYEYQINGVWLTYGSFDQIKNGLREKGWAAQTDHQNIRKVRWTSTHLRTYLAGLFRKIEKQDLIDSNTGDFYQYSADMAIMMPMIEMAGNRARYLSSINYVYNDMNPINEYKIDRASQIRCEEQIRNRKKYEKLEKL